MPRRGSQLPQSSTSSARRNQTPPVPKAIGMRFVGNSAYKLPSSRHCTFCGALIFAFESRKICCNEGQIHLSPLFISDIIYHLYTRDDDYGAHFRQYARVYNNFFAFSTLGGELHSYTENGIHTVQLQGQLYHFLPNLVPDNDKPNFLQMYFYDGAYEFDKRIKGFKGLWPDIVTQLMSLSNLNPYARFFRSVCSMEMDDNFRISISKNPVLDQRVYNCPSTDEVAAIFVDNPSSSSTNSPNIIVHAHGDHVHRVFHYYGCYDPLQYPLLFYRGESGWHYGIRRCLSSSSFATEDFSFPVSSTNVHDASDIFDVENAALRMSRRDVDKLVSCREYYCYRLQIRSVFSIINMGRILLQYINDMYIKIENTRLDFIRHNQTTLRAELYQGIVDSVNDGVRDASSIGRCVILPASFIGGPRDMKRRYLNAMALVQRFGKPDLFITMTCNTKWPEITNLLQPWKKPHYRPDIIARIFRAKVVHLKDLITKKRVFGSVAAHVDVIEFQKRDLPHVHMLIILKGDDKILNPDRYDQYVSAELPDLHSAALRSRVVQHMMHDPCGKLNERCGCMKEKDGVCTCRFKYPKNFSEFTTCGADTYRIYRRRNNNDHLIIRGKRLDNRWVVPYNPYLLMEFDCHMNVEICSTIKVVKYIYKYVYKGHDRICFDIAKNHNQIQDEPKAFQSARWVTPPEAAYRIYKFDLYSMNPSVCILQVHLPHMHNVAFNRRSNMQDILNNERSSRTILTTFFEANTTGLSSTPYLYSEFPEHHVWDTRLKVWRIRDKRGSVGRMTFASLAEGERYYLRLLLCNVRGPKSFINLLTVNGYTSQTFQESCEKRGYLEQEDYADVCMEEAVAVQMPSALRRLFVTLLVFVDGVNPINLWTKYYDAISEDISYIHPHHPHKVQRLVYNDIEKLMSSAGRNIKDFHIPEPQHFSDLDLPNTREISDALNAPVPLNFMDAPSQLNALQRIAYDAIIDIVTNNKPGAFFIDGPGGTGKTFLYCALYTKVRSLEKIVLPTATSGIAASNIPTGRTAHSRFKIPLNIESDTICKVSKQSSVAALLRSTSLFIWDEASMAKKEEIESVDLLLQEICNSKLPFRGKVFVFGGDFRQVLPVLPHKGQNEAVKASLVSSYIWPTLHKFRLTENICARDDPEFSDFLLHLGNGMYQTEETSAITIPNGMIECIPIDENYVDNLVAAIYPEIAVNVINPEIFTDRAILTPRNDCVDILNDELISRFPGESIVYTGVDTLLDDNHSLCTPEFLNSLCPPGMSPYKLVLKKDCPVILLRNLDPCNGLCNGTRLICKEFNRNIIICEIATGYRKGERVILPRISLRPLSSAKFPFSFQRRQFPIKLCFAMTINKAQGQTLQRVCLFFESSCFSHGQLYVGLSRAKKRSNLKIFLPLLRSTQSTLAPLKNIVSFDILCKADIYDGLYI